MNPSRERAALTPFLVGAALIVVIGVVAYLTSFSGAFVLDDNEHIVNNIKIRHLWPIGDVLAGSDRPIVYLTMAINYALGALDARGYHAVNLAIHVLAALVLFAILIRTFRSERLRDRYGRSATGLAAAAALVWVAHPLQTAAVTYVIQRGESLAGLFWLLTLFAVVRGSASSRYAGLWYVAAVASCGLGMATKPVMVTAPLVILLYDRMFLVDSWRDLFRRRGALHVGLAATWSIAGYLAVAVPNPTAGFGIPITPLAYAMSQPGVILHYLTLALWPSPLVFDYGWPIAAGFRAILLPAIPIVGLVVASAWALVRGAPIGFLGACFFLTLAPSSSAIPIKDLAFEHRMYLPLAPVAVLLVVAGDHALRRWKHPGRRRLGVSLVAVVVVSLAWATSRRNLDYRSEATLWRDVLAKRPENSRGYYGLGAALVMEDQNERAIPYLLEALRRQPTNPAALHNLGVAYLRLGRFEEAISRFDEVLRLDPHLAQGNFIRSLIGRTYHNRGVALAGMGRYPQAIANYREAIRLAPDDPAIRPDLGIAEALQAQLDESLRGVPALLGAEFEEVPGQTPPGDLILDKTYRRIVNGKRIGHIRVLIDLTQPDAHVQFEVEGEIPKRTLDDLSRAIAESMRRSGAEQIDRSP